MIALLQEIWEIFAALWATGSRILRVALVILVGWPALITLVSFIGWPTLTAIAALLPLMGGILLLIAWIDPLVIAVVVAFTRRGRQIITWVIACELLVGVYLSLVPVHNDRGLIIPIVLVGITWFLFVISQTPPRPLRFLFWAGVIVTIIFFLGGRARIPDRFNALSTKALRVVASTTTPTSGVRILTCGDGDEYISSNERVVMVEAGNGCHTKWQNRPEQSTRWDFGVSAVDRTIKGKIAFSDGSEKPFEDNPRLRTTNRGHVTAYRFETQTAPYLVKIIMK